MAWGQCLLVSGSYSVVPGTCDKGISSLCSKKANSENREKPDSLFTQVIL